MQRRDFLRLAGGTALAAALPATGQAEENHPRAKLQPAVCAGFDYKIPFAEALAMIRQAGFERVSLGAKVAHSGYATAEGRAEIRRLLERHQLTLDSIHAPSPQGDRLFALEDAQRLEGVQLCQVAIDAAQELQCPIVVVHLLLPYDIPHGADRDRRIRLGHESLQALIAHATERGIKLALENGQRQDYDEVLEAFLTEFNCPTVGFCYDSGHENVRGRCFQLLEKWGHRLLTVHLHDNRGSDTHVLPEEGNIHWDRFREVFYGLDYHGNLHLEVDRQHSQFQDPATFLAEAYRRAQRLLELPPGVRG